MLRTIGVVLGYAALAAAYGVATVIAGAITIGLGKDTLDSLSSMSSGGEKTPEPVAVAAPTTDGERVAS